MSAVQELHDIEIGGGLIWPEDGKILVYLGWPLDPPPRARMYGEAMVGSFAQAEAWLRRRAKEQFGTVLASYKPRRKPIVQLLFEAGIPGSVYWIHDGAFGTTIGDKKGSVSNFAEAERWLAENAPLAG